MPKIKPIKKRGPFAMVFRCPHCRHAEIGNVTKPFDCTKAHGRMRTHMAKCKPAA